MNNRNSLLVLLVAALLAAGAWYLVSPYHAMSQLRSAAIEGDVEELRERVDFPSVREKLKADLSARMAAELADDENDAGAQFGAVLGMAFIGPMIDGIVTPEMIGKMLKMGQTDFSDAEKDEADETVEHREVDWDIEREGFSKFRAIPVKEEGEDSGGFVFERDGLGWKLTGIEIPDLKSRSAN
jgi:hypothetical protein